MTIFKYAIYNNRWLWFHILGGAILAKVLLFFFHMQGQLTFEIVLSVAVAWEIWEFAYSDVEKIYGSVKIFILDALGDIAGATLAALIIIL